MDCEPVAIVRIPGFGDMAAPAVCAELGIKSQNEKEKLAEAKRRTYLKGFTEGIMLAPEEYKGMPVQQAKPLIREVSLESLCLSICGYGSESVHSGQRAISIC